MKLTTTIAAAALAVAALALPSAAMAGGKSHLLGMYKVEKHIDLEGEQGTYKIKCNNGDIAVDGMWRIDNVDQDNDYVYDFNPTGNPAFDVLLAVEPAAAYPSGIDEYTFKFVALSGGDVQGKLFLTCLPKQPTAISGHTNAWQYGSIKNNAADTTIGPGAIAPVAKDTPCLSNEVAIQPGFKWDPGDPDPSDVWGKPYMRYPATTGPHTGWKAWNWEFVNTSTTSGDVRVYWRCLSRLTTTPIPGPGTHRHQLALTEKLVTSPPGAPLKASAVSEVQVICGDHYKGMLGAWDFSGFHGKLWFLGMDPRPKARAYKVLNTFGSDIASWTPSSGTGPKFANLCFKDRTT